jgi:aminoglycoside phosphotransferase (APT) family kinase protein
VLGEPCLVLEFVEGETGSISLTDLVVLRHIAIVLARIHATDPSEDSLPRKTALVEHLLAKRAGLIPETAAERSIRDALAVAWPPPGRNPDALLHGDFWPGNILWRDGEVVAVVDWEDAAIGDPLADLANIRLELLWAAGDDAMHAFTAEYLGFSLIDARWLPVWDLAAALVPAMNMGGWGLTLDEEREMRRKLGEFVNSALAALHKEGVEQSDEQPEHDQRRDRRDERDGNRPRAGYPQRHGE